MNKILTYKKENDEDFDIIFISDYGEDKIKKIEEYLETIDQNRDYLCFEKKVHYSVTEDEIIKELACMRDIDERTMIKTIMADIKKIYEDGE